MGSNLKANENIRDKEIEDEGNHNILQFNVVVDNDENIYNNNLISTVAEFTVTTTKIHFREIPKDKLKKNHIEILLGPERATRPGEIEAYEKIIIERKSNVRSWGIEEVRNTVSLCIAFKLQPY
jgi:hypothetical protein